VPVEASINWRIAFSRGITISRAMATAHRTWNFFEFVTRQPSQADRIARIDALATLLDTAIVMPGTQIRFGLDALIGLIPVIGDAITTAMSLYIVREAHALGAPKLLVARMLANVAVDGVIGAVPLVGDAFDVVWRANRKNMALLLAHLDNAVGSTCHEASSYE